MKRMLKAIPFVKKTYRYFQKLEYERQFAGDCYSGFRGVFDTFEQAIQSAPKTKPIGYDNDELAKEYQQIVESEDSNKEEQAIDAYEYPILFWLNSILIDNPVTNIFDFGGNVGNHFYKCKKYLNLSDVTWTVCDLPAIIKAGKDLAEKRQVRNLLFTTSFQDASHKSLLIASGSVQYINDFPKVIEQLPNKPLHILINRLPIYPGKQFVTLQNGGQVFYPQYVFNSQEFIDSFEKIGYELRDFWKDRGDNCIIPFHPENSLPYYHGMYFKLKG